VVEGFERMARSAFGHRTRARATMTDLIIRSSRGTPVWGHFSPLAPVRTILRHAELIRGFAAREILERHKGAFLGIGWNILSPLIQLAIYTFVFGVLFENRWNKGNLPEHWDFALTFFAGQTFFQVFAECANRAPVVISSRPNLVRKVVFPLEILPVTVVASSLVHAAISLGLLLVVLVIVTGTLQWTLVLVPVVALPLIMLSLGVTWALSAIGVFVRDMRQIVVVATQLLMFMTPLFYRIDRIPEKYHVLRLIVEYNPLSVIVENARRVVLWGEMPQWGVLGAVTIASFIIMMLGYAFFGLCRRGMADVH
jgi:lipopolysaccharide transport system permease protein